MKKTVLGFMSMAAIALAFSSCSNDDEQSPVQPGTSTVEGRITANLDATSIEPQAIPAGTGITFIIDGRDLDPKPDNAYQYDKVTERAEVDAEGRYTVSLPARKNPINAQVVFDAFEFDATIITTNDEGFQETTTARKVFSRNTMNISIVEGQSQIRDFTYTMEGNDFVNRATIRGTVEAQINDNVGEVTGISNVGNQNQITGNGNDTLLTGGAGYTNGTDIAVTGGTGTGMTVNIQAETIGQVFDGTIDNPGENYFINSTYSTTTTGNGTGLQIRVTAVDAASNNAITDFVIPAFGRGNGYAIGDIVNVMGGNNLGSIEITEITEGKVTQVTVNQSGEDYTVGDVVTISGGTGATFEITGITPRNEPIPANVVLSFRTNNGNGETYRTTTNTAGEYVVQIPVLPTNGSDNIQVRGVTFETASTYLEDGEFVTGPKIYYMNQRNVQVFTEDIKEEDFTYLRRN